MRTSIKALLASTLLAAGLASAPAFAQEAAPSDFTISGNVAAVTDYRFRGLSLSGGDFAVQGSIGVSHSSGFYVGAWASSLEDSPVYGSTELDVYAGWTGAVTPGVTVDAGLLYYVYPNGDVGKANVYEPYASVSTTVGPVGAKVGVAYAWKQDSLGGDDNLYVYGDLSAAIPETPISLSAHLGYTDGALSPKLLTGESTEGGFDYNVGATYNLTSKLSLGVSYVGVDGISIKRLADGPVISNDAVVGTIKLSF